MVSVVSTHRVDNVIEDGGADVTPPSVHWGDLLPKFLDGVETPARVEIVHTVESSDDVDVESNDGSPVVGSGTRRVYFLDFDPSVGPRVVRFYVVRRGAAAPTPDGKKDLVGKTRASDFRCDHFTISEKEIRAGER